MSKENIALQNVFTLKSSLLLHFFTVDDNIFSHVLIFECVPDEDVWQGLPLAINDVEHKWRTDIVSMKVTIFYQELGCWAC